MAASSGCRARRSIAVVVPARDCGEFIEAALASALSQTRPPDDIVVVDDGSSDDTSERVLGLGRAVKLVRIDPSGVAAARNAGVGATAAEFIAFLDADDFWDTHHLERMTAAIEATGGRSAVYFSDMRLAPEHGGGTIWSHCRLAVAGEYDFRPTDKAWLFAPRQPMLIQASVVSRAHYDAVGGSDQRLTRRSDTHLLFKLGLTGPLCAVAGICGKRTAQNERSLTRRYAPSHRVYDECTALLYADLLTFGLALDKEQRRILSRRAAAAHLSLAARSPQRTAAHLWTAFRLDARTPALACTKLGRRLAGQWSRAATSE